jgi:hypothetical protein
MEGGIDWDPNPRMNRVKRKSKLETANELNLQTITK